MSTSTAPPAAVDEEPKNEDIRNNEDAEHDDAEDLGEEADEAAAATAGDQPLSKNARKRALKKENQQWKRKAEKEAKKEAKRAKREANQAAWDAMPEEEKAEIRKSSFEIRKQRTEAAAAAKVAKAAAQAFTASASGASASGIDGPTCLPPTCIIDLGFDDLMTEREIASLAQQTSYSHSANRKSNFPMRLALTSLGGQFLAKLTAGFPGHENWPVLLERRSYLDVFDKNRIVYLSSESERVLDVLEPGVAYVVGGLVDHNRHKGLTHRLATQAAVPTARLPIDEHLAMSQRRVLAVNHVVEILVLRASGLSWPEALVKVMPERRGAKQRDADAGDADAEDGSGEQPQVAETARPTE